MKEDKRTGHVPMREKSISEETRASSKDLRYKHDRCVLIITRRSVGLEQNEQGKD